jgi:hypothetical protein
MTFSEMLRVDAEFWAGFDLELGSSELGQVDAAHHDWVENFGDVWDDITFEDVAWLNLLIAEALEGEENA